MERRAAERAAGRKAGQPSLWSPGPIPALLLIHGVVSAKQPTPLGIWGFFPPSSMRRQNWVSISKSMSSRTLSLQMLLKKMVLWP